MPEGELDTTYDCSSLVGITSWYYGLNGAGDSWGISANGYFGNCWSAPDPNNSGNLSVLQGDCHVEFYKFFNSTGYIEFMFWSSSNGNSDLEPQIYIDDNLLTNVFLYEDENGSGYIKARTDTITAGNRKIKILFDEGSGDNIKVDEIKFFELK